LVQKIKAGENFKLIIGMPLMPGSEGELTDKTGGLVRVIMGFQYYTLFQGRSSILERLKQVTATPEKYFQVFGLRNHAKNSIGNPVES
jgi:phospholipase D1/2